MPLSGFHGYKKMLIKEIFEKLKDGSKESIEGFRVATLPIGEKHKIGISGSGLPVFFISCAALELSNPSDYDLEHISIQFNRKCQLFIDGNKINDVIYTVVSLKTGLKEFQDYFLSIVYLILEKLNKDATGKEFKSEIDNLALLFTKLSDLPQKTIQGLWAELLVIEQSERPDYLIAAWHNKPTDRFDFNDGADKIEVKSTTCDRRQHSFSNAQLLPNKSSELLIASVLMAETGSGKTIQDLVSAISVRVVNKDLQFRLNEVIGQVLGKDLLKAYNIYYDYKLAVDSLEYFESKVVPSISETNIPSQISNIHYECDLTGVPTVDKTTLISPLHKALFSK